MAQKTDSSLSEKAKLEKKIHWYSQYHAMTLMPIWSTGLIAAMNRTPIPPGRVIYVAMYYIGVIFFGIGCFVFVHSKIKTMQAQLARMEKAGSVETTNPPPIPDPKNP